MNKLQKFLTRFSPPGSNLEPLFSFLLGGGFVSFLTSLGYLLKYSDYYYDIVDRKTGNFRPFVKMPPFEEILSQYGFRIFAVACIALVVANYLYFFQESKSIYTMRRLRSPWELHLRCWTLPARGALLLLLCSALLTGLYALHYFTVTPPELLPAQFLTLWR